MTTLRPRTRVSLAAALTLALTLGGCASASSRLAGDGLALTDGPPLSIRFDNGAQDYVHVYLVDDKRQWLLGRVEPGAHATLRIPDDARGDDSERMWLSVRAGERTQLRAAGDARAATINAAPLALLLSQRWTFSQLQSVGQLTSLPVARVEGGPR